MSVPRWVLGAIAAGLGIGAMAAQAAPMPVTAQEALSSVQTVQFFEDDPPIYYDPPPRRPYGPPPVVVYDPPPRYYGPPRDRYYGPPRDRWERRPPPPPQYRPGPYGGFWNKEEAKDYVKSQRRAEKEVFKQKQRAWNRANGY